MTEKKEKRRIWPAKQKLEGLKEKEVIAEVTNMGSLSQCTMSGEISSLKMEWLLQRERREKR